MYEISQRFEHVCAVSCKDLVELLGIDQFEGALMANNYRRHKIKNSIRGLSHNMLGSHC